MAFVVDDLASWLVGLLADAGRKRLIGLISGGEQERALRPVTDAAIRRTAEETCHGKGERAEHVARVIGEVFRERSPSAWPTESGTILEGLQLGVAQQLAVLSDADLTGTGQSSEDALGISAELLARTLTDHLVAGIISQGAQAGPLSALANQLNHDWTHLQNQQTYAELRRIRSKSGESAILPKTSGIQVAEGKIARVRSYPANTGRIVRLLPQPAFLAGRENLLKKLDAAMSPAGNGRPKVAVLYGLGGCGKTSLALTYAHHHLKEFAISWFLQAEAPTALTAGFGDLATQLGPNSGSPVTQVHAALAAHSARWLLVFDNVSDPAEIQHLIPPVGDGCVLITSQYPHWPGYWALEVPTLDQDSAAAFLQDRTGSTENNAARDLAEEVGGLPLALEQAAAYITATGWSMTRYLDFFRRQRGDLLARGKPVGYGRQVATAWTLAFDQLEQTAPSAIALLRLLACYSPERIPVELILGVQAETLDGALPVDLLPLLNDPVAAADAQAALGHYSLISVPKDGIVSVHRLVQAVTVDHLADNETGVWRKAARMLIELTLPEDPASPDSWPVYSVLLPHAEATLPLTCEGMTRISDFLGYSGNYPAARDLSRKIAKEAEQVRGAMHPRTLAARADIAYWTGAAGDEVSARDQLIALLPLREQVLGSEHPDTLNTRASLAYSTGAAGDPDAARDQYKALLPVCEQILGPMHADTITIRSSFVYLQHKTHEAPEKGE